MNMNEIQQVEELYTELCCQPRFQFPQEGERLEAPSAPGVYIIRKDDIVLHVGRTLRGKNGLYQRLMNHVHGQSSFTEKYLKGNEAALRNGCTYQLLVLEDSRLRALVEALAIGMLCPKHIGLGEQNCSGNHPTY